MSIHLPGDDFGSSTSRCSTKAGALTSFQRCPHLPTPCSGPEERREEQLTGPSALFGGLDSKWSTQRLPRNLLPAWGSFLHLATEMQSSCLLSFPSPPHTHTHRESRRGKLSLIPASRIPSRKGSSVWCHWWADECLVSLGCGLWRERC